MPVYNRITYMCISIALYIYTSYLSTLSILRTSGRRAVILPFALLKYAELATVIYRILFLSNYFPPHGINGNCLNRRTGEYFYHEIFLDNFFIF